MLLNQWLIPLICSSLYSYNTEDHSRKKKLKTELCPNPFFFFAVRIFPFPKAPTHFISCCFLPRVCCNFKNVTWMNKCRNKRKNESHSVDKKWQSYWFTRFQLLFDLSVHLSQCFSFFKTDVSSWAILQLLGDYSRGLKTCDFSAWPRF